MAAVGPLNNNSETCVPTLRSYLHAPLSLFGPAPLQLCLPTVALTGGHTLTVCSLPCFAAQARTPATTPVPVHTLQIPASQRPVDTTSRGVV